MTTRRWYCATLPAWSLATPSSAFPTYFNTVWKDEQIETEGSITNTFLILFDTKTIREMRKIVWPLDQTLAKLNSLSALIGSKSRNTTIRMAACDVCIVNRPKARECWSNSSFSTQEYDKRRTPKALWEYPPCLKSRFQDKQQDLLAPAAIL